MGYDMYLKNGKLPGEDEVVAEAKEAFHSAYQHYVTAVKALRDDPNNEELKAAHDHALEAFDKADEALIDAQASYFRLNVSGMSAVGKAMRVLGMLSAAKPPPWPDTTGIDQKIVELSYEFDDEFIDVDVEYSADEFAAARELYDQRMAVRAYTSDEDPRIPEHKLSSNYGWLVLPEQIQASLDVWDRLSDDMQREVINKLGELFNKWINWLRRAKDHGGFVVY